MTVPARPSVPSWRSHLVPRLALALLAALCMAVLTDGPAALAGAPGDELPDGAGKKILTRACTSCHDLGEVTKFKGYYSRAQWRDIVVTMKEYGAELSDEEVDALADYIAEAIGKR